MYIQKRKGFMFCKIKQTKDKPGAAKNTSKISNFNSVLRHKSEMKAEIIRVRLNFGSHQNKEKSGTN